MPAAFPVRVPFPWRLDTANRRLAVALAISLLVHAIGFTTWKLAPAAARLTRSALARVLPRQFAELHPAPRPEPPAPKREVPLIFVEVDPALASAEPPKETPNYSTHNSLAANPEPKPLDVPKIDGTQTRVLRTTDNPKPQPQPLQPAPAPERAPEETPDTPEPKPKQSPPPGDLALAKNATPTHTTGDTPEQDAKPRTRPRTIREAMARNPALAGEKAQQDGGVQRRARVAMLDAKGSPFGNYDSMFIAMVQQRWYALLENNQFMTDRRGKVVVTFRLHHDGRISEVHTAEDQVGDVLSLLCQKAILDPAPFPRWPTEMRRLVGSDTRDVRFTFYYD